MAQGSSTTGVVPPEPPEELAAVVELVLVVLVEASPALPPLPLVVEPLVFDAVVVTLLVAELPPAPPLSVDVCLLGGVSRSDLAH